MEKKTARGFVETSANSPTQMTLILKGFSVGQQDNTENSVYHWWGTVDMKQKQSEKIIYYGVPQTPYCSWRHTVQPQVGVWCAVSVHKITGPEFSEVQ